MTGLQIKEGSNPTTGVSPVVGILALQGDFAEHKSMSEQCGASTRLVKYADDLSGIDGLIIPGGESTTIAKLTGSGEGDRLFAEITRRGQQGMPVYGTCMGTIFLASEIEQGTQIGGAAQGRLALMNITVKRNAFGPQLFSREQSAVIPALGRQPFNLVFIRGPIITKCGNGVEVLAQIDEGIVMARQDNLLVTAFHPELTGDTRVHRYFLQMCRTPQTSAGAVRRLQASVVAVP